VKIIQIHALTLELVLVLKKQMATIFANVLSDTQEKIAINYKTDQLLIQFLFLVNILFIYSFFNSKKPEGIENYIFE